MLKTKTTISFILFFLTVSSANACDKNDIDYYLEKDQHMIKLQRCVVLHQMQNLP